MIKHVNEWGYEWMNEWMIKFVMHKLFTMNANRDVYLYKDKEIKKRNERKTKKEKKNQSFKPHRESING